MLKATPALHLRTLINKKYGRIRFALGTEIVARWVQFETKQPCSMHTVVDWCKAQRLEDISLTTQQLTALQQLFNTQKIIRK